MKKTFIRAIALGATLSFAVSNVAFAGGSIGYGDISVMNDDGKIISKLSGQNPVQDSSLLACDGKCMLKSEGISVIAEDKSKIAVANEADTFKLFVQEGTVNYVINNNTRKIAFYTPQGTYTVAEVVFNADSAPVVKGLVSVDSEGKTEISVTEGRMVFTTADGIKAVGANQKIVLAQVPPTPATQNAPPSAEETEISTGGAVFIAAVFAGAVILPLVDDGGDGVTGGIDTEDKGDVGIIEDDDKVSGSPAGR